MVEPVWLANLLGKLPSSFTYLSDMFGSSLSARCTQHSMSTLRAGPVAHGQLHKQGPNLDHTAHKTMAVRSLRKLHLREQTAHTVSGLQQQLTVAQCHRFVVLNDYTTQSQTRALPRPWPCISRATCSVPTPHSSVRQNKSITCGSKSIAYFGTSTLRHTQNQSCKVGSHRRSPLVFRHHHATPAQRHTSIACETTGNGTRYFIARILPDWAPVRTVLLQLSRRSMSGLCHALPRNVETDTGLMCKLLLHDSSRARAMRSRGQSRLADLPFLLRASQHGRSEGTRFLDCHNGRPRKHLAVEPICTNRQQETVSS